MVKQGKVAGQVLGTTEIQVENITSTANQGATIDFKKYGHVICGYVGGADSSWSIGSSWVSLGSIDSNCAPSSNIIIPATCSSSSNTLPQIQVSSSGAVSVRANGSATGLGGWYSGYFTYIK